MYLAVCVCVKRLGGSQIFNVLSAAIRPGHAPGQLPILQPCTANCERITRILLLSILLFPYFSLLFSPSFYSPFPSHLPPSTRPISPFLSHPLLFLLVFLLLLSFFFIPDSPSFFSLLLFVLLFLLFLLSVPMRFSGSDFQLASRFCRACSLKLDARVPPRC